MVKTKLITTIIMIVIVVVIIFTFIGAAAYTLRSAGDSITDANNCSGTNELGESYIFNITDGGCYNGTAALSGELVYTAIQYDLPLNTLFGRGGVVLLVLMAAVLLLVVGISIKFARQGK